MDRYRVGSIPKCSYSPQTYIRADRTVIRPPRCDRLTDKPEIVPDDGLSNRR